MDNEKVIQILDLKFKPYIDSVQIENAILRMSKDIVKDFKGCNSPPLFIVVLNGAFIFASDLLRKINLDAQVEFVRLKSYSGLHSSEHLKEIIGLQIDIKNRDVIIVEDIVDTGYTLDKFIETLKSLEPLTIKIASLIFKKEAFKREFKIDYCGFEIENKFIVGYGMDYNEYGRNLKEIYQIVN